MAKLAAELVARCFAARTAAHFAHLRTKSYSSHKALESFYEDIVHLTDRFAEAYQGVYGVISTYPDVQLVNGELANVHELRQWLDENQKAAAREQSELSNLIDEIKSLCDATIYKLVNLK